MKEVRYEDFDVTYWGNRFGFLGNGYTGEELDPHGNAVWYFDVLMRELEMGRRAFEVQGDIVREGDEGTTKKEEGVTNGVNGMNGVEAK
jgi:hypothetical protein